MFGSLALFLLLLWLGRPVPEPVPLADVAPGAPQVALRDGRQVVLLAREHRGALVDVRTDRDLDPRVYADLADRLLPRLREWFGAPRNPPAKPPRYTLFLCSSVERMLAVERLCGEPSSQLPGRSFAYRGGFYARSGMAILPPRPVDETRWLVAHELTHAVFAERVGCSADVFDEGLAELLPDWLLFSDCARPEELLSTYPEYEACCGRAARQQKLPSVSWLYSLDYWAFRDERSDEIGFAASWSLMKLLVESREPGIAGRMQAIFDDLERGIPAQAALVRQCDLGKVERAWQQQMRDWAEWEPAWGRWDCAHGDWSTTLSTWSASLLLAHESPHAGAFQLGFTWHTPADEYVGLGFALGMQGEEDLAYLRLVESERRVQLDVYRAGELEREYHWPLPSAGGLECEPIVLNCAPGESATLRIGERRLVLDGFDAALLDGRCGLVAERLLYAPRRIETKLTFGDPWIAIAPAAEAASPPRGSR